MVDSFTNLKALFPVVLTDFSLTGPCQKLKTKIPFRGLLRINLGSLR